MPQAVAAWIITAVSATGTAAALIQAGVALAFNFAVSALTRPKGPSPQEVQTELRKSDTLRLRHLGRVRAAGAVMFYDWRQSPDSGFMDHSRVLHKLLAVGQGGIDGVEQWWLGDETVSLTADGVVSGGDMSGYIRLKWRSGSGAERAGGQFPGMAEWGPAWGGAHRLDDVGCIYGQFRTCNPKKVSTVYPQGDPEVRALIRGARCFDPRDGSYSWSDNAARQVADILTHPIYGGLSASDIDATSFAQAFSDCDAPVEKKGGGTVPRYVAGGSYSLDQTLAEAVQPALDACAGQLYLTPEGKVGLRVGKWRAPIHEITPDKCVSISIRPGSGSVDKVSTLIPNYTAPEAEWQTTTADPWDDTAAIALYGERAAQSIDLPWVQHHGQARRLAKIKMARLNPRFTATVKLRFWGLLLMDQESVYLTDPGIGLLRVPFWIDAYAFDPNDADGVCTVSLISADPVSFNWNPTLEEGEPPAQPEKSGAAYIPPTPVITLVEVIRGDGVPYLLISASVTDAAVGMRGRYRRAGTLVWTEMTSVSAADGVTRFRSAPLADQTQYDAEVFTTNGLFAADSEGVAGSYGIEVYYDQNPPDPPSAVSASGSAGGTLTVTFEPDLGVNYRRTGLYMGGVGESFESSSLVKWTYATSAQVTLTAPIPSSGARFWLRSENASGRPSAPVSAGAYPSS